MHVWTNSPEAFGGQRSRSVLERLGDLVTDLGMQLEARRASYTGDMPAPVSFGDAADQFAHRFLCGELVAFGLGIPVISEEDKESQSDPRPARYWLIDPVDGTASYRGGFAGYVTQLALMEDGQPILAAIYVPASDELFLAERAAGSVCNGIRLSLAEPSGRRRFIDNYPEPRATGALLYDRLACDGYVESGSLGLKICRIADGTAEIFFKDVILRDWDIAPAALILEEAGGTLTTTSGNPFVYSGDFVKSGVIATANKMLAAQVAAAMKSVSV